jgi:hypothetical protein
VVLRDIITLYQQDIEVTFHPGLELENYCCSVLGCKWKINRFVHSLTFYEFMEGQGLIRTLPNNKPTTERWKHIYVCYKKRLTTSYGFAELCFLCSEWIVGKERWKDHC